MPVLKVHEWEVEWVYIYFFLPGDSAERTRI